VKQFQHDNEHTKIVEHEAKETIELPDTEAGQSSQETADAQKRQKDDIDALHDPVLGHFFDEKQEP